MMTNPPLKLLAKLHKVMSEVQSVAKRGRNTFHKYDYATEADVIHEIRGQLIANKLLILPSVNDRHLHPCGDALLIDISLTYLIYDIESGESLERNWVGHGTDKGDKGLYKAYTGGNKYFLLKTFLLPTDADPENDGNDSKRVNRTTGEVKDASAVSSAQQYDQIVRLKDDTTKDIPDKLIESAQNFLMDIKLQTDSNAKLLLKALKACPQRVKKAIL